MLPRALCATLCRWRHCDCRRPPRPTSLRSSRPKARAAAGSPCFRAACSRCCGPRPTPPTIRLLNRLGVEVVVAKGAGCCGALGHHMGFTDQSHAFARAQYRSLAARDQERGLDAIVITASGCGTTVKDYGFMFRTEPDIKEQAAEISAKTRDITEYLVEIGGVVATAKLPKLKLAYHSACSMQHGQQVIDQPRDLLAGGRVRALRKFRRDISAAVRPAPTTCCSQSSPARLRDRKAANIASVVPDLVATGNIGCMQQLSWRAHGADRSHS